MNTNASLRVIIYIIYIFLYWIRSKEYLYIYIYIYIYVYIYSIYIYKYECKCISTCSSWRQHPHKTPTVQPPCPLCTKTIQVRRTRHAGHCWRSRDELIRDVLLWTPTHGRAKSRTTSTNIYSAAMWGYGLLSWRPT